MQIPLEIEVAHLDLKRVVADRTCMTEEFYEIGIAQVIVESGRIGANLAATGPEKFPQWHAHLLGRKVPKGHLERFMKRQAIGALVATARPSNTVDQGQWRLADKSRPNFVLKDPGDFRTRWQGHKESLGETQATDAAFIKKLNRRNICIFGTDLAVTNDAIPRKLEPGYSER